MPLSVAVSRAQWSRTPVVRRGGPNASDMGPRCNPAVAWTTLVRRSHIAFPPDSNRSMSAKYPKRIRVRSDAARTVSPTTRQPKKIRFHPADSSGATAHKAAVGAMSKTYRKGNQRRAKSLAPRTPYFRTKGVFDMSDVFISSM
jgi:hypothetical protein